MVFNVTFNWMVFFPTDLAVGLYPQMGGGTFHGPLVNDHKMSWGSVLLLQEGLSSFDHGGLK